jgi:hypothetical protein
MFEPTTYEIVIRGRANGRVLHPLLDDFVCDHSSNGVTRLIGEVHDPAHLHGVVTHLTAMNAELISIAPIAQTAQTGGTAAAPLPLDRTSDTLTRDNQQEWTITS